MNGSHYDLLGAVTTLAELLVLPLLIGLILAVLYVQYADHVAIAGALCVMGLFLPA